MSGKPVVESDEWLCSYLGRALHGSVQAEVEEVSPSVFSLELGRSLP